MNMARQKTTDPNRWTQLLELLATQGFDGMKDVLTTLLNEAMRLERTAYLQAEPHQRTPGRRGYANGYKTKRLDTRLGEQSLEDHLVDLVVLGGQHAQTRHRQAGGRRRLGRTMRGGRGARRRTRRPRRAATPRAPSAGWQR